MISPRLTTHQISRILETDMLRDLVRRKERPSMRTRTFRARVRAGRLEPLEELKLIEGAEVMLTIEIPGEAANQQKPAMVSFDTYDLGVPFPLTRAAIYDNLS